MLSQKLEGKKITLLPIAPEHRELLRKSATDDRVWKLSTYISKYSPDLFNTWFTMTFNNSLSGSEVCFSIAHASELIGSSRYYLINEVKKEISIGFTWIHPDHWDSSVNPEMKYLMLKNAFDHGFEKVYFHIDHLNLHSQAAVKKLGGILTEKNKWSRMRLDGSMRETMEFVITKEKWPEVIGPLQKRIL
jgi:RimJ/RimL family protein N-acetyltransferase